MEPLEIVEKIRERFPNEISSVVQFRDQVSVSVKRDKIFDICRFLSDSPEIRMDFLSDLCGVDHKGREFRFEVVYNLYSIKHGHRIRVKALIPENDPSVDSVVPVWSGANWHEREACDMFGIVFRGHPDLRRILMPEDWEGNPLRKDYPLEGPAGWEYKGYEEVKDLHTYDDEWRIR
ncbi:MAG: NADH-quinone oxidoreductase subunit C [Nitrospirae bacterium]|nr:NADH-quinone oxidoreductase subunit C [Nitrospirota bacterium]